jgi:hypothetical protein
MGHRLVHSHTLRMASPDAAGTVFQRNPEVRLRGRPSARQASASWTNLPSATAAQQHSGTRVPTPASNSSALIQLIFVLHHGVV